MGPAPEPEIQVLRPLPWQPCDPPPAALPFGPVPLGVPPLLLLIDRRRRAVPAVLEELAASLSASEGQRHAAYRLAADRERFLLGRGGLRQLLGLWLGLPPQAVPIQVGRHGKPHCPAGPRFNLSHSGDLILLALHPSQPVGVDVEQLRPWLDWQALARRLLSPGEQAALAEQSAAHGPEAFLGAWCRLEAELKARGEGLAGLEQRRLERAPEGPAGRSPPGAVEARAAAADRVWQVAVPAGYRAAAALGAPRRGPPP